jgi:Ni/Co efflux regulator RcnB
MESSRIVCVIAAAALGLGSLSAFAQGQTRDRNASNNPEIYQRTHPEDNPNRNLQAPGNRFDTNRNDNRVENRGDNRGWNNNRADNGNWNGNRRDDRAYGGYNGYNGYNGHNGYNRGYQSYNRDWNRPGEYHYGARGPEFRRGGYIPYEYRNRSYYVSDWRGHRLSAPPVGYQWVQVGGDYVLIALATGLIANLILNQ